MKNFFLKRYACSNNLGLDLFHQIECVNIEIGIFIVNTTFITIIISNINKPIWFHQLTITTKVIFDNVKVKMVLEYHVPKQVIDKFTERGKNLAFLAGYIHEDSITVSHMIIPIQFESRSSSSGKCVFGLIYLFINVIPILTEFLDLKIFLQK